MSFFKKMFSANYRDALALEGAGRYKEAAEAYMLAGERASVARMHRLAAKRLTDPYERVDALRVAHDFGADLAGPEAGTIRADVSGALADALIDQVEASGLMDRANRALLEEALTLFAELDRHSAAGEALAKLGHFSRAAAAFEKAGHITKMEEMFRRAERKEDGGDALARAYDALEFAEMAGDHVGVLEALERCVKLQPREAVLTARLQSQRDRMPKCGRISLVPSRHAPWHLVGGPRAGVGRDDDNEVLMVDAGVSRRHALLTLDGDTVTLEDLGSSHGTWIGPRRLSGPELLGDGASFRVGSETTLALSRPRADRVALTVQAGHLKGQVFTWADHVVTDRTASDVPPWLPSGLALRFLRGYWHVLPEESHGPVILGALAVTESTLLRLGDELRYDDVALRIR